MSTAATYNFPDGDRQGLQLSNERFIRQLPFGTWAACRIGFLLSCQDTGANGSGEIWAGLCTWNTNNRPMDKTALAFRWGNAAYNSALTMTRSLYDKRVYTHAAGQRLSIFKAGTETSVSTAATRQFAVPADNAFHTRALVMMEFYDDSTNWIARCHGSDVGGTHFDWNPGQMMDLSNLQHANSVNARNDTTVVLQLHSGTVARDVTNGALDSLFLYWRNHSGTVQYLTLHGYFAKKLA